MKTKKTLCVLCVFAVKTGFTDDPYVTAIRSWLAILFKSANLSLVFRAMPRPHPGPHDNREPARVAGDNPGINHD
jgi:hypothetical protein